MPYESRCRPTSPPTTAAPQFSVPVDVASHTGAMQAQEHRIQRIMKKRGLTEEEARKTIEMIDTSRENYIQKFTDTSRYDAHNYDLVISMKGKTEDQIANMILMYLE